MANKKWLCVILEAGLLIDGVKVIKTRTKVSIRMLVKEYEFEHDFK